MTFAQDIPHTNPRYHPNCGSVTPSNPSVTCDTQTNSHSSLLSPKRWRNMTRDECEVDPEESRPSPFKNKVCEENHLIEDCRSVQPKADQGWSWDGEMIQKSYLIATTRSEDANHINLKVLLLSESGRLSISRPDLVKISLICAISICMRYALASWIQASSPCHAHVTWMHASQRFT
jgi:hypothetical protein